MFCTDDKHPNDLLEKGHIDYIIKKAIAAGVDPIIAVKAACHNAARYFLLNNRGAIAPGYLADFVIIDNFRDFNVQMVLRPGDFSEASGFIVWDGTSCAGSRRPEIDRSRTSTRVRTTRSTSRRGIWPPLCETGSSKKTAAAAPLWTAARSFICCFPFGEGLGGGTKAAARGRCKKFISSSFTSMARRRISSVMIFFFFSSAPI